MGSPMGEEAESERRGSPTFYYTPLIPRRMAYARLAELTAKDDGKEVSVAGWAEDIRNLGGIAFVILRQREGTLQLAVRKKDHPQVFDAVANLTREDGVEFLALASKVPVRTTVQTFPLSEANEALARLRDGRITGAAVLLP